MIGISEQTLLFLMCYFIIVIAGIVSIIIFIVFCVKNAKKKKLENNVHFYVARDKNDTLYLYLSKPVKSGSCFYPKFCGGLITSEPNFKNFDLEVEDFKYLKWDDEPVEVFLNLYKFEQINEIDYL